MDAARRLVFKTLLFVSIWLNNIHVTTHINFQPVFKRFTEENTPPTLYNHGFENMDSLGGVYSRASSHIFGDWNAW